jgi:hypothetical protein
MSETLHPIKKAAALTRALAVASSKMNTTSVLGETPASRPSSARMIIVLMGSVPVGGLPWHMFTRQYPAA